jgi:hypothetical protein
VEILGLLVVLLVAAKRILRFKMQIIGEIKPRWALFSDAL